MKKILITSKRFIGFLLVIMLLGGMIPVLAESFEEQSDTVTTSCSTDLLIAYLSEFPTDHVFTTSDLSAVGAILSGTEPLASIALSEQPTTQQDYLVMLLYMAGMQTSQFAGGPPDFPFFNYNEFARSAGFFNNWEFIPNQVLTADIIASMTIAMLDKFNGLRDALAAVPRMPYFVNGMAVPIFEYGNSTIRDTSGDGILRFVVYVETEFDTDGDGQLDLIKVLVQLPNSALDGAEFATIFEARPYIEGTVGQNPSPLHRARGDAFLAANPDFNHYSLWSQPPPRVAQGAIARGAEGVAHMVDNAVTSDWFYQFLTQNAGGGTYTATYNLNPPVPGSQVRYEYENLNWYDYFLVRGFAVVAAHGPAGLNSQGLSTMGADVEIAAFKAVIEWLTGNARAFTNKTDNIEVFADWSNGRIGMTGRSYAGTTQFGLATTGVEGLKTIVPVAGIASWYDYTNSQGTFVTWEYTVGLAWHCNSRLGAWTTQARAASTDGVTPNWEAVPTFVRSLAHSQLMRHEEAALAGNYGAHWARRDYTRDGWFRDWGPSRIQTPMFIIHGLNDDNVRTKQSEMMYRAARSADVPVRLMWNQGEHMTPTFPFANANPYLNVGAAGAGAHRPFVMYCGEYTFDELLNLWFSYWLYEVDNNVLERIPYVIAHNNSTGEWDSYDTWHDTDTLTITGNDFRINTTSEESSGNTPQSTAISFSVAEEFLIFDEGGLESEDAARPVPHDTYEPAFVPFASSAAVASADNRLITINSANGLTHGNAAIDAGNPGTALNWWNNMNYSTAGSAIYSITLTEDTTIKGVVEVSFRAAFESLGAAARDNLRVHAKLVEVAAPDTTINFFGTPRVGATPARVLIPSETQIGNNNWLAWQGGGARNSNMVEFALSTGTFREIGKGWMDLTNPGAGFESYTAGIESQIDPQANIGVWHDYTIYLQPSVHTALAGNRLVLILTTGGSQPAPTTGPSANPAHGIDRFSFTVDNNYINIDIPIAAREVIAPPTAFDATNPARLSALLETDDVVLQTRGNLGIFAQHSPLVIPEDRTLYIETTLNIQRDAELIIKGTVVVLDGGRINNQGSSNGGGTITIAEGGTLVNYGHVENVSNSTVVNYGTITNNARFEVRAGTMFIDGGYVDGDTPLRIHSDAILERPYEPEEPSDDLNEEE
ncbi:MAG: hypothetical protein FWD05_11265 [Oscillospiraceae bacterium]|nr:hypothetical protein [Oscillospiraceae bacterium]